MNLSFLTISGMAATLALILAVGVYAGKKVRGGQDFNTGSNMGVSMIAGSLVGTLVGGASTIGTAQLAFSYGFSAWWFSLGGGIGLLIMAADWLVCAGLNMIRFRNKKSWRKN